MRMFTRPAVKQQLKQMLAWLVKTKDNGFDASVLAYPGTFTICAYNKERNVLYMPVQQPFMLESLGINPDASAEESAFAIAEATREVIMQAHIKGVGEIYFLGSNEKTNAFATKHGFEEVPFKVYRMKLQDLEPKE